MPSSATEKNNSVYFRDNFDHLQAELRKLDLMLKEQVLKFRLQTQAMESGAQRHMYISHEEVDWLLDENRNGCCDSPEIRENRRQWETLQQEIDIKISRSLEKGVFLALPLLADMFVLSPLEVQMMIVCLARELDHKYDTLYAFLQDDMTRRKPTVDLILELLCQTPGEKWRIRPLLSRSGRLFRSGILQTVHDTLRPSGSSDPAMSVKVDARIVDFIMGNNQADERLSSFGRLYPLDRSLDEVLVAGAIKSRLSNLVRLHLDRRAKQGKTVLYLYGPYGAGKCHLAQAMCKELNCPLFRLDLDLLPTDDSEFENVLHLAFREGLLTRSILFLDNVTLFQEKRQNANVLLKKIGQAVSRFGWLVFMAGKKDWAPEGCFEEIPFVSVKIPVPSVPLREQAWQAAFKSLSINDSKTYSVVLARRYELTPGQILRAAASAVIDKGMDGKTENLSLADLSASCRNQAAHKLAELSIKVRPQYEWDDIVLPAEKVILLKEICSQVRHRYRVFDQWGFDRKLSYGKGLSVLFSGPSGTGKTMAAQVIANELQLDLYKIDLSGVVSKYIGETEKNLHRIFYEAERSNAILFFDEADALFGKRTEVKDAHDRYANIETSYLLQKMEEYEGMVILATNLRSNMDEAFTRRIRFIVEFPFPDAGLRARIWKSHFPGEAVVNGSIDYDFLSKHFKVAGGSIRNIVLNTAFLAAEKDEDIGMEHVLHGVKREFEKIGKLWTNDHFSKTNQIRV